MLIKVKFFAYISEWIKDDGKIVIELEEGSNILDLLQALFKLYDIKDKLLDDKNQLKEYIAILKNGREINFLSGLETILDPNDEISIFPPVTGG